MAQQGVGTALCTPCLCHMSYGLLMYCGVLCPLHQGSSFMASLEAIVVTPSPDPGLPLSAVTHHEFAGSSVYDAEPL